MKISMAECCILIVTGLFLSFTLGYFIGSQNTGVVSVVGAVTIQTQYVAEASQEEATAAAERLDINTADSQALAALPGLDEELAERIVAYREANGAFTATLDLLQVEGMDTVAYAAIQDYITVGGAQ